MLTATLPAAESRRLRPSLESLAPADSRPVPQPEGTHTSRLSGYFTDRDGMEWGEAQVVATIEGGELRALTIHDALLDRLFETVDLNRLTQKQIDDVVRFAERR